MKAIHQFVDTLTFHDAIGNYAFHIQKFLHSLGIESNIYVNSTTFTDKKDVLPISQLANLDKQVGIIFHHSTYTPFIELAPKLKSKILLIYHNITPSAYLRDYSYADYKIFREAERQNYALSTIPFVGIVGDSQYNLDCLAEHTKQVKYKAVAPPFLNLPATDRNINNALLSNLKSGAFNFLFVGRIASNKKQSDIIKLFEYYQNFVNPNSRLILTGYYSPAQEYYHYLQGLILSRNIKNVIFTGKIADEDLMAYYKSADCFVSMSEHEGFCIPIIEAIANNIPVIAYDIAAVREILPDPYLFGTKNYVTISKMIEKIEKKKEFRNKVIADQHTILEKFNENELKVQFKNILSKTFHI